MIVYFSKAHAITTEQLSTSNAEADVKMRMLLYSFLAAEGSVESQRVSLINGLRVSTVERLPGVD